MRKLTISAKIIIALIALITLFAFLILFFQHIVPKVKEQTQRIEKVSYSSHWVLPKANQSPVAFFI